METELLSQEESQELIRLVNATPGDSQAIDPQHALVLYALKLITPNRGNKAQGYVPTKAGFELARKLNPQPAQGSQSKPGNLSQHWNTDPNWPFPIRVR